MYRGTANTTIPFIQLGNNVKTIIKESTKIAPYIPNHNISSNLSRIPFSFLEDAHVHLSTVCSM
jgi:hypothetical protein